SIAELRAELAPAERRTKPDGERALPENPAASAFERAQKTGTRRAGDSFLDPFPEEEGEWQKLVVSPAPTPKPAPRRSGLAYALGLALLAVGGVEAARYSDVWWPRRESTKIADQKPAVPATPTSPAIPLESFPRGVPPVAAPVAPSARNAPLTF